MAEEFVNGRWVASKGDIGLVTEVKSSYLVVQVKRQPYRFVDPVTMTEE